MKLLSYNILGLGGRLKWKIISKIVCKEQIQLLCLQETKQEVMRKEVCTTLWGGSGFLREFNEFINNMELEDVPLNGRSFTWFRPNGKAISRIDRILISREWWSAWENCVQFVLDRNIFDHCPLMLSQKKVDWGPKPFRSINCWSEYSHFEDIVKEMWDSEEIQGWGCHVLKEKLKALKVKLKYPFKEFCAKRGLRQGDPLAPFLFTIIGEGLSGMMREACNNSLFTGFRVGKKNVEANLLQYADDTIFIGEEIISNVLTIKAMLRCFELVSSLKVNFFKSRFGGVGLSQEELEGFSSIMNYKILSFPFTYLGIPIGENPREDRTWNPVVEKVCDTLTTPTHIL
uniref:Reverse transcriptase domain-containing protein n=1 Tax=Cajanus cajan TaxID=3821 RepID=A0A151RHA0_CAJCA|nr:hypothetical protein KK1_036692 [Cajanus cajan]